MESLIEASFEKDFENNDCEYFFTLLDARFDYLNYLWVEELEKKFKKKFKPIFVSNTQKNKFHKKENSIILNERLLKLQKLLRTKKIVFQSETEDLNLEFCHSELIGSLIKKLLRKKDRVFV